MIAFRGRLFTVIGVTMVIVMPQVFRGPRGGPRKRTLHSLRKCRIALVIQVLELLENRTILSLFDHHSKLSDPHCTYQDCGLGVRHIPRRPCHRALVQPEDRRRFHDRRVERLVRKCLRRQISANPLHDFWDGLDVEEVAASCIWVAIRILVASGPVIKLLPAALKDITGPHVNYVARQNSEEHNVEDSLTEHQLHCSVL
mmetsp:Transcript_87359/g.151242  ORF Transcript_87359/g.151242 Transcript_87359/m.151242 type:complete len:200 (+) Transcript_87359:2127-2726(+)